MKKNDLIKLLQSIEGNPEIKLWNGYVQDVVDISPGLIPLKMYKYTLSTYLKLLERERQLDLSNHNYKLSEEDIFNISKTYNQIKFEYNSFPPDDSIQYLYKTKDVIVLQAKLMNKSNIDRLGKVEY